MSKIFTFVGLGFFQAQAQATSSAANAPRSLVSEFPALMNPHKLSFDSCVVAATSMKDTTTKNNFIRVQDDYINGFQEGYKKALDSAAKGEGLLSQIAIKATDRKNIGTGSNMNAGRDAGLAAELQADSTTASGFFKVCQEVNETVVKPLNSIQGILKQNLHTLKSSMQYSNDQDQTRAVKNCELELQPHLGYKSKESFENSLLAAQALSADLFNLCGKLSTTGLEIAQRGGQLGSVAEVLKGAAGTPQTLPGGGDGTEAKPAESEGWSTGDYLLAGAGVAAVGAGAYLIGKNNPKSKFKNDGGGATDKDKEKDKNPGGSGGVDEQQCPDGLVRTPSGTCALPPPTNNPGAGDTTESSSSTTGGMVTADLLNPPGGGGLDSGVDDNRPAQDRGLGGPRGGPGSGGGGAGGGEGGPLSSGAGGGGGPGSGGGGRYAMGGGSGGYGGRGLSFGGDGGGSGGDSGAGVPGAVVDQNFVDGPSGPRIKFKGKLISVKQCKAIPACLQRNRKLINLRTTDPRLK